MHIWGWIAQNLFTLLSSVGIIAGLWFTAFSLRAETKTRRVANLLTVTENHRAIWTEYMRDKKLARVGDPSADIATQPVTNAELMFVAIVIQHINSVYYVMSDGLVVHYEGLRQDIAEFFSLPIPRAVWRNAKPLQNLDFASFMDSILGE